VQFWDGVEKRAALQVDEAGGEEIVQGLSAVEGHRTVLS